MARFFQFTDQNGDIVYIEPELIQTLYTWPQDPTLTFIQLTDGSIRVSTTPVATLVAFFTSSTYSNGVETAVSNVAVQVAPANAVRRKLIVQNTGLGDVRVGTTGVTATTGTKLVPNGSLLIEMPDCPTNAIFAIREGGIDSVVLAQEIS